MNLTERVTSVKRIVAACALVVFVGACGDFNIPNYNNQSLNALIGDPNATRIYTAVQGLEVAVRAGAAADVLNKGVQGRETYVLTPETPGSVTERLIGPLTPLANGSGEWSSE